jgi:hypothetical protein
MTDDPTKKLFEAVKAQQKITATDTLEGDPSTWHIRLYKRFGPDVELWVLYNGDSQESSPAVKSYALRWRNEELEKEKKKP